MDLFDFDPKNLAEAYIALTEYFKSRRKGEAAKAATADLKELIFVPDGQLKFLKEIADGMHAGKDDKEKARKKLFELREAYYDTKDRASSSLQRISEKYLSEAAVAHNETLKRLVFGLKYQKMHLRERVIDHVWEGLERDDLALNELKITLNEIEGFNRQLKQAVRKIEENIREK